MNNPFKNKKLRIVRPSNSDPMFWISITIIGFIALYIYTMHWPS